MNSSMPNRSWAEIDLDNLSENMRIIRRKVRKTCEIMAVVKADAYGHGVDRVVPVLLAGGATRLAVSMLDEAIQLRQNGIDVPILVLGYTDPRRAEELLHHRITQTVFSRDLAQALSDAAIRTGIDARVHIKVDTGMGRVGFMAGYDAVKDVSWIRRLPGLVVEGLYTHFASADEEDITYTEQQFEKFMSISREMDRIGLPIPIKHVCNSAATMRFPQMHLDMIRPGLILYGMLPQDCPDGWSELKPAMTLKANIVHQKYVPAGASVSYGRHFIAKRESHIITIPIGYADGYSRRLGSKAKLLLRGVRVPVAGSICMDTLMADITDLTGHRSVQVGEQVVMFGNQQYEGKNFVLSVDEVAEWLDTINYEVTCIIGKRVPRVYIRDGRLEDIRNYLI